MSTSSVDIGDLVLQTILADEAFTPSEPTSIEDTGLPVSLIESLILKRLATAGLLSGRQLARELCIPFNLVDPLLQVMRTRQILVHKGSAPLNDYEYVLTEAGRSRASVASKSCAYNGPAPVTLMDYILSAEAQTIRAESPKRNQLANAFRDISIDASLFEELGPAINSGAGLFLYGEPGNGKSTIAQRITQCFGQKVWIPHAIYEDGQIIKFFDAAYHQAGDDTGSEIAADLSNDPRWIKVTRPTVMVGGELTMESLEIRHDPVGNVSEASIQMKSNCGCLLIDDFGRQRVEPRELLNRWIVPLESNVDFLTLSTGKKIQVPFEQLIIFSTNLEPCDLVDDAFLRRIPYKIEISDPTVAEFHNLFKIYCQKFECEYDERSINYLVEKYFVRHKRRMRRCHPRDLLKQIQNYCAYNELPMEIRPEYFDLVVRSYFTAITGDKSQNQTSNGQPAGE